MKTKKNYFSFLLIAFFLFATSAYSQSISGQHSGQQTQSTHTMAPPSSDQILSVTNLVNYQAVARNVSGNILANQLIGLRLTIENGSGGPVLYQETQTPTTNQFGLFTIQLGNGTVVSGTWSGIVWSNGNQWLKVDMDPTGGNSYTAMGESQMLSVPFSNFAATTAAVSGTTNNVSKFISPNSIGNARITDDGTYIRFGTTSGLQIYDFGADNNCDINIHNNGVGEAYFYSDRLSATDNGGLAIGSAASVKWLVGAYGNDDFSFLNATLGTSAVNILHSNNNVGIGTAAPLHMLEVAQGQVNISDNEGNTTLYDFGLSDGNALYVESNETGDHTGTTVYSQAQFAGYNNNNPLGAGNSGVWGTVTGVGSTGYGIVGSYGLLNDVPFTYAGLGGQDYAGYFGGKTHIVFDAPVYAVSTDAALSIDGAPTTNSYPAVILYSSVDAPGNGCGFFGFTAGTGVNVGDGVAAAYAPVTASAFNVASDIRMKHDVSNIGETNYSKYLDYIRNIQSATFKYNFETDAQRSIPHIGVIAQSLPAEVQAHIKESPSKKNSEDRLGVNLADLAGLSLVGIKALDSKQTQMEKEIADLKAEIQQLKNRK